MPKIISISTPYESEKEEDAASFFQETDYEALQYEVQEEQAGERLDKVLSIKASAFSRSYWVQLIEQSCVKVNQKTVNKASTRLKRGDHIECILKPPLVMQAYTPQDVAIETHYVDEHIRVINKPAGLVVHPGAGHWQGTLLNGLLFHDQQCADLPRAGIVHRLDKDTSGLMVVARTRQAMDSLVKQMAARDIQRGYVACVHHQWRHSPLITVEGFMGRDLRNRIKMAFKKEEIKGWRFSRTHFNLIDGHQEATLLGCKLDTGRTHQVRVQLAHLGHPLIADGIYGGKPLWGLERQALHAYRLMLTHPSTGEVLKWTAILPHDMQEAIQACGLQYNEDWISRLSSL